MSKSRDQIEALLTEVLDETAAASHGDRAIVDEPDLRAELDEARAGKALLTQLTPRSTPAHFERRVQQRVRRRTGGRYYSPAPTPFGFGITIDAFVVLAVAIMAACWFMSQMPAPASTLFPDPPSIETKGVQKQMP